jgi:hypothetical protein
MKFYVKSVMFIFYVSAHLSVNAFWSELIDTCKAKINNTSDVIVHKEFKNAKQLELHNINGSIVINSWKQDSIAIEIITTCSSNAYKEIKIDTELIDKTVKIHTIFTDEKIKGSVIFNILVPTLTDLAIFTKQGDLIIKDVRGNQDLVTLNGNITLINPHATIHAKTHDGNITVRTNSIEPNQEFFLESGKGDIVMHTTTALQAYVNAKALQGKVICQIPIALDSKTTCLNADAWKNFRQQAQGTIGQPLSKLTCIAHDGSIEIAPYLS